MAKTASIRVGIDIGGTFTDVVLAAPTGTVIRKVLSTPEDFSRAVIEGILGAAGELAISLEQISEIVHATTVATNAILQRSGAACALITTEGFRDVLELGRLRMPRLYDIFYDKSPPLIPRRRVFEVRERIDPHGAVIVPLDSASVTASATASIIEQGEVLKTRDYEVGGTISATTRLTGGGGYPINIPVIDVAEVGAGGGSLAWIDSGGSLRVGALAQAVPEQVFAATDGGTTLYSFGGYDEQRQPFVLTELLGGSWGGRPDRDGIDGIAHPLTNQRNIPAELLEVEHPLRVRRYGFVADTGGAGRFRGGLSLVRDPLAVAADVVDEKLSAGYARERYGVAIDTGAGWMLRRQPNCAPEV